jgi:predicted PurR-regulated permease PerM
MKKIKIEISIQSIFFVFAFFSLLYLAYVLKDLLLLLFLAFIINSGLRPLVDRLENRNIPRVLSIVIIYALMIGFLVLLISLIVSALINQANDLFSSLPIFVENLLIRLREDVPAVRNYLDNNEIDLIVNDLKATIRNLNGLEDVNTDSFLSIVGYLIEVLANEGLSVFQTISGVLFSIFIVLITSVYMLSKKEDIYEGFIKLLPYRTGQKVTKVLKKIEVGLGEWLLAIVTVVLIIGFLSYLIISIPGIFLSSQDYEVARFAVIIGLVSGSMELVPQIGAMIAFVFAVGLTIITGGSIPVIIYVAIMFILLQQAEGLIISPIVMKKVVNIDPVISIFTVLAGLRLGGPFMAALSIPLIVTFQIIISEVTGEWRKKQKIKNEVEKITGTEKKLTADLKNVWKNLFSS